jgi:hypothetical protein
MDLHYDIAIFLARYMDNYSTCSSAGFYPRKTVYKYLISSGETYTVLALCGETIYVKSL